MNVAPRFKLCNRYSIGILAWLALSVSVSAQVITIERAEQPRTFQMTVSPATEPKPALKYRFLVPAVDKIHGNAATLYYKAMSFEGPDEIEAVGKAMNDEEKYRVLFEAPLNEFPQKQAEELTRWLSGPVGYGLWLREAARCDYCDWRDGIREEGFSTLLPQAQKARSLANALALRTRLQIIQHKPDEAIETLRVGYALSRDLGKSPTLVQCLVGIAIQGILNEQTRELIAAENSPNLYWALTDLAAEPADLREALSYESRMWEFSVHELADIDRRALSPEEALKAAESIEQIARWPGRASPDLGQVGILAKAVCLYPQAREYLLEHGYTRERIEAMPVVQTVLLAWWKEFAVVRDNCYKWLVLPDDEVRQHIQRSTEDVFAADRSGQGGVFTSFLPAVSAATQARIRAQRQTDLLRVVEALRMYAAEHGRWPEKLDDITMVSIPLDPWTRKPFDYSVKEGVAMVQGPLNPPMAGGQVVNQRYELRLRPAAK